MTFDGQPYASGAFVFPSNYNSGSSWNGIGLSTTLSNLYFLARNQARMVFQVAYGWNDQTPAINAAAAGYSCIAAVHSEIAHVYARIPAEATRLQAFITFGAQPIAQAEAQHLIRVVGGHTGSSVDIPIQATSFDNALAIGNGLNAPDWSPANTPLSGHPAIYHTNCDVTLAGTDLSVDREIVVEGCIVGGIPVPYRPWFVSCWWEVD